MTDQRISAHFTGQFGSVDNPLCCTLMDCYGDHHIDLHVVTYEAAVALAQVLIALGIEVEKPPSPTATTAMTRGLQAATREEFIWPDDWEYRDRDEPRRRQLIKAAALLIAEIERLDRAAARAGGGL